MNVWSVIVAAGRGTRFGSAKQLEPLLGRRVVDWSVDVLANVGPVVVVGPGVAAGEAGANDPAEFFSSHSPSAKSTLSKVHTFTTGGASRSDSVRAGLSCLGEDATHVLVHDAARPAVTTSLVERVLEALRLGADAAIPVVAVTDSLRTVKGEPVDRSLFVAVQTPQGFRVDVLHRAHRSKVDATDDSTLVAAVGGEVVHVSGDPQNLKITERQDLHVVETVIRGREHAT